ncbi:MAG: hypothetical protein IIU83_00620 [Fibrobacteraceae bacterium]|nr:hypothetical protein [Fibrobacteraceae bacterium]
MVKILLSLFLFFVLVACSGSPSPENDPKELRFVDAKISWPPLPPTDEFVWTTVYGFLPNQEHQYGFDKNPLPNKYSSEDSITNISARSNDYGYVNVFVAPEILQSEANYEYGLCDLRTKKMIEKLQFDSQGIYEYVFFGKEDGNKDSIALCKKLVFSEKDSPSIIDKLNVHSYNYLQHDILIYLLGERKDFTDLLWSSQLWDEAFPKVYGTNLISISSYSLVSTEIQNIELKMDSSGNVMDSSFKSAKYINVHVPNSDASCYEIVKDDIDYTEDDIRVKLQEKSQSRAILGVGWPTRKMWSLKLDNEGFVQVCGTPEEPPEQASELMLVSPLSVGMMYDLGVTISRKGNYWVTSKNDTLTNEIVDVSKMVFIESGKTYSMDSPYLGYHLTSGRAVTKFKEPFEDDVPYNYDFAYTILPWGKNRTIRTLLHEMGHMFGLVDLDDTLIKDGRSEQGNLMHWEDSRNGVQLRNRPILKKNDAVKTEKQWDCLHRKNIFLSCADSSIIYFNYGE